MSTAGSYEAVRNPQVWGACGVEDCRDCFPLFDDANEPITDNFGRPL